MFDPTPWGFEDDALTSPVPHMPIYLTGKLAEDLGLFAVVDLADYTWAMQWRWQACASKSGNRRKQKYYAARSIYVDGRGSRSVRLWLHKEILLRNKGLPKNPAMIIGDHQDGESLNCRSKNLEWATPRMNRQNYHGLFALQMRMDFKIAEPRLVKRAMADRRVPAAG